jgi:hypothetical protein
MRAVISALCVACVLIGSPSLAGDPKEAPKTADEAALMWMQALGDRWPERWQGRRHYLFDEDNPPETTATGRAGDARACAGEPVRVRRADGSTEVQKTDRCR